MTFKLFKLHFPDLYRAMEGCEHNSPYHQEGSVLTHTKMVYNHAMQNYPENKIVQLAALLRRKDINIDRESYARNWALQKKYNISLLTFNKMREDQNNTCTICNKVMILPTKGKGQGLNTIAVDHCHTTGKVRGLLCSACNEGIGLLSDDINILENAIKYLKGAHNAKTSDSTESASTS